MASLPLLDASLSEAFSYCEIAEKRRFSVVSCRLRSKSKEVLESQFIPSLIFSLSSIREPPEKSCHRGFPKHEDK
jgi:hypothetical protein